MGAFPLLRAEPTLDSLAETVVAGIDQQLVRAETLPPDAYTSESFYKLEMDRIFSREWLCVGHVSLLPAVGDHFPIDLFGELLMVVRGVDRVRVLSRVCPHRWAPLVSAPGNARFFSCPFHKWAFALDGKMLGAPLMDRVEFDPRECSLPEYRSEVIDGFIFVNFDDEAAPLGPRVADLHAQLDKFALDKLIPGFVLEYDVAINWKIVVETFMECYHHIAAHPETFERLHPARMSYVEDGTDSWTIGHSPIRNDAADDAVEVGFPLLGEMTREERREFRLYLVYPFHIFALLPDRAAWFCLQPEGPARTKLQTHILVRPEARDDPEFAAKVEREKGFFAQVNSEDIAVNEMQMRGASTRAARAGRLCDLEKACWQLAHYVRRKIRA